MRRDEVEDDNGLFKLVKQYQKLVEKINEKEKYDVIRIERETPYSDNYDVCAYKKAKEEINMKIYPAIKPMNIDFDRYDKILLFSQSGGTHFQCRLLRLLNLLKVIKGKFIYLLTVIPMIHNICSIV